MSLYFLVSVCIPEVPLEELEVPLEGAGNATRRARKKIAGVLPAPTKLTPSNKLWVWL